MKITPSSRKTYVEINNSKLCLNIFYIDFMENKTTYEIFRQRIIQYKKRGELNTLYDYLLDAAHGFFIWLNSL